MLKRIADDVWAHEKDIALAGGMRMPCRSTILRLPDGRLVVHSPLAIDDATAKELDAIGDVRFLVAPNCVHWMFLKAAKERYPKARVFGSPGLAKKLGSFAFEPLPESGASTALTASASSASRALRAWRSTRSSTSRRRSLLVTDLMFNVHECGSFGMRLFLRVVGAWKKTTQSRMWWLPGQGPRSSRDERDDLAVMGLRTRDCRARRRRRGRRPRAGSPRARVDDERSAKAARCVGAGSAMT